MSGRRRFRTPSPHERLKIGLFGGSFDPAHAGHLDLAETALRRLDLAYVWWLPSRGHILKTIATPFADRFASARRCARAPTMRVSAAESQFAVSSASQLVRSLKAALPQAHLVWLMGADGLTNLHRWVDWVDFVGNIPLAAFSRSGVSPAARLSPFTRRFAAARRPAALAPRLALARPPAWLYVSGRHDNISSTAIRSRSGAAA